MGRCHARFVSMRACTDPPCLPNRLDPQEPSSTYTVGLELVFTFTHQAKTIEARKSRRFLCRDTPPRSGDAVLHPLPSDHSPQQDPPVPSPPARTGWAAISRRGVSTVPQQAASAGPQQAASSAPKVTEQTPVSGSSSSTLRALSQSPRSAATTERTCS